ncbi:MAG: HDOD domain-containing protein [Phycisphaeraceae bacterium]|nr:HDOD domain-containing protein [Phycisphaerales bacterium]MCB9859262.1 HDOD domain-containing protein [Phycisphaeraceae bacterium]
MSTQAEQEQIVASAIREISHIATLPEITLKIVELVEDPKSTAQDLHKVINNDPALSSRILKVVNSSFYGLPGQIGSINRAIVMLGLNAVKNIAIAASLAKLFRGGELTNQVSAKDIWEHSIAVAATMKLLADRLKLGLADEAFLAGLMHDIGLIVEMQFDRNKLIDVFQAIGLDGDGAPCLDMLETEQQVFGANHQQFGAALCEKWKFPRNFAIVAGHHHDPLAVAKENRRLPCMAFIADRLVSEVKGGFRADFVELTYPNDVLDELGLSLTALDTLKQELPSHLDDASALLS